MQNDLTLASAREMSNDQLLGAMRSGFEMSEAGIRRACIALAVLEERNVPLPMLPEVYRYAREIAEGELSPRAGLILGKIPNAIRSVMKLPLPLQDEVAEGRKVKIAVKVDGRIQSREATIFEMTQLQMRLAFGDGGFVSWEEQGSFLLKATPEVLAEPVPALAAEKPSIRVDSKTCEIVVNRTHLKVDDLIPALSALGYIVKPAYGGAGIKPVKVS